MLGACSVLGQLIADKVKATDHAYTALWLSPLTSLLSHPLLTFLPLESLLACLDRKTVSIPFWYAQAGGIWNEHGKVVNR